MRLGRSDFKTAAATSATVTWRAVRRHRARPLGWSLGTCGSRTTGIGLDARAGRVGRVEQPITGCTPDRGGGVHGGRQVAFPTVRFPV